jgi:hypothetical protein
MLAIFVSKVCDLKGIESASLWYLSSAEIFKQWCCYHINLILTTYVSEHSFIDICFVSILKVAVWVSPKDFIISVIILQVDQWLFGTITYHGPDFWFSFTLESAKWKSIGALEGKYTIFYFIYYCRVFYRAVPILANALGRYQSIWFRIFSPAA